MMADTMPSLTEQIDRALSDGKLRADAAENIRRILSGEESDFAVRVIGELSQANEWEELNDRFYKTLAFGTGGLRGRTIAKIVTPSERGTPTALGRPEFPCVGTNAMNYFNVGRATRGLVIYIQKWRSGQRVEGRAKIVIAHDTRHFSQEFTRLAAETASANGCDAVVFDGPRSTPELSFAVRYLNADAGIVITASHNPPHDNGYKVYFNDGAQVIEPHASGIIAEVNEPNGGTGSVPSQKVSDDTEVVPPKGEIIFTGDEIDRAYMERLGTLILDRGLIERTRDLKIVYTPIHGTGGVIVKPILRKIGLNFSVVPEQDQFDGRFPTVKSPNPENAEALNLGISLAQKQNADLVVATDPDCDRMGVAVRTSSGEMKLLSGNQIGSLLAWYRAKTFFDRGILNKENAGRGVIIKTIVTSDLQKAIAEKFGLRCVDTLTGFKYNGAKLKKYEELTRAQNYRELSEEETRRLRLEKSSFYIFGGEESYGYSAADFVRDKDGNAAVIMFCEVAACAKSRGLTLDELLDQVFCEFGYFEERNHSAYFEGADGAEKIRRLLISYDENPPRQMLDSAVTRVQNFEKDTILDSDGDEIPKEKMLIFELADKTRVAVRGSGTEPKIKYYLFGARLPANAKLSREELARAKTEIGNRLGALWSWLEEDANQRLAK
ncbi:MAG TPA: phospho-sugar mutase [Chthoniobacterales bacterium]|nr:phospho-sugar mutase [Chthoniobacterales bacterium]